MDIFTKILTDIRVELAELQIAFKIVSLRYDQIDMELFLLLLILFIAVMALTGYLIHYCKKKRHQDDSNKTVIINIDGHTLNGTTTVYQDNDVTITVTKIETKN